MSVRVTATLYGCVGGGLRKGTMASAAVLPRESCPPDLTLMPDTVVPLHMPLVPFKLLPWCRSPEGVSLSKSVCRTFKKKHLGLQKFLPPIQSLLVFTYLPGTATLAWGTSMELGILTPKISFPNFYSAHTDMGPAHSTAPCLHISLCPGLHPSYQSEWMWFLI